MNSLQLVEMHVSRMLWHSKDLEDI